MTDSRAVSTTLSYVLALTVITVLASGLFVTTTDLVEDQRERAIRSELQVIGNRIAADISAVDRMVIAADGIGTAELSTPLPERVAGSTYRINVTQPGGSGPYELDIESIDPTVTVTVEVRTNTTVATDDFLGGDIVVRYDGSQLTVSHD